MLTVKDTLVSQSDRSINVIFDRNDGGTIEARRVQRLEDTLVVYLSSHVGCNLSCRMCHLTQMGMTDNTPVTIDEYLEQAEVILRDHLRDIDKRELLTVHMNFMSRGDALANPYFVTQYRELFAGLDYLSARYLGDDVEVKFKISTIFPENMSCGTTSPDLKRLVVDPILDLPYDVEFYYSLYALNPEFRKRWIPKAISPDRVGRAFFGRKTGLRLHHALIFGENDSPLDVEMIHDWLYQYDLTTMVNIVRYNPYSDKSGVESPEFVIKSYADSMEKSDRVELVQIVSRLSTEVYAACGMFQPQL